MLGQTIVGTKYEKKEDPIGSAVSAHVGVVNPPVDLWDRSHPKSFLSLMPEKWVRAFEDARHERAEYFELDERDLYKRLRSEGKTPSAALNTIRLRLWLEYERCQASEGKRIGIFNVLGEVCRNAVFEKSILSRPERVAWLLCPPTSYKTKVEEALDFGIDRLRDILELDPVEEVVNAKTGKSQRRVNVKLGELQAKIVNMLDVRVHGAARQRIEQTTRQVNLNFNADAKAVAGAIEGVTAEELDRRIKWLEWKERRAMNLPVGDPEVIDGEVADAGGSSVAGGGGAGVLDTGDAGGDGVGDFGSEPIGDVSEEPGSLGDPQ